jgi:hypothetical protein
MPEPEGGVEAQTFLWSKSGNEPRMYDPLRGQRYHARRVVNGKLETMSLCGKTLPWKDALGEPIGDRCGSCIRRIAHYRGRQRSIGGLSI